MTLERIGRFRIERALGSGSFSTVWLAVDEELDDRVAIKLLADNWSQNEDARRRFVEEGRAMRRIDSDRIVRIHELGQLDGLRPYMVMEFADRGSLEDRMRLAAETSRPFSVSDVTAVGIELASCLTAVHEARVVHRDVKPSNVLFRSVPPEAREALARTGRPAPTVRMLLGDFGIARRMEIATGTIVVGSPRYMAPEQGDAATAHRVDARADVYSAGVILRELLPDATVAPPSLDDAIARATSNDPGDRYATAWEFRADLVRSLGDTDARSAGGVVGAVRPAAQGSVGYPDTAATAPGRATTTILAQQTRDPDRSRTLPAAPAPTPAVSIPEAEPARLGAFDAMAFAAVAGAILAIASLLPWALPDGGTTAAGIDQRAGTIVFAAGGLVVLSAILRWTFRSRWALRAVRIACDVAAAAGLASFVYLVWTVPGALGSLFHHGISSGLGTGVYLLPVGAVVALIAASRAKRQLRTPARSPVAQPSA